MITKLQDLFISLLSPWIPFVGKLSERVRYGIITGCFVADLVLFCIVRYVLHKESYFYNTVFGIILMIIIAILSLDRSLVRIHWRRSLWMVWYVHRLFCIRPARAKEGVRSGSDTGAGVYRCVFCLAEPYKEGSVVEVF